MIRKLMAALDGSDLSEKSLPWVRVLANRRPVILMHVTDPIYGVEPKWFEVVLSGEKYLERLTRAMDPGAKILVRVGSVVPTILDAAKELGVDLIALTTHGHTPVGSLVFGSTVEKMMHHSDLPLLIVPDSPGTAKIDRIVVPLDGSKIAEMILPLAKFVAREHRAEVILVHALTTEAHERTGIPQHLQELTVRLSKSGVCTKLVVKPGAAEEVIASVVESEGADLMILSAHGFGSLTRKLFGSTASRLLRSTTVPAIVARDKALRKLAKPAHKGRTARKMSHQTTKARVAAKKRR